MTTTTSISGQSIGTGSNIGYGLFPQKVTIQSTTTAFNIGVRITNGASAYNQQKEVTLYWASSPFSITAAQAVDQLKQEAKQLDIRSLREASAVTIRNSDIDTVAGLYVYFWFDCPSHTIAQTLDASCVELP